MIEGRLINIRPVKQTDLPAFIPWTLDENICDLTTGSPLSSEFEQEQYFSSIINSPGFFNTAILLAIESKDNKPIGYASLHSIDWKNGNLFNDIVIAEEKYRSKGAGAEAVYLLGKLSFSELNMHKLCGSVYSFNEKSIKLMKGLSVFGIKYEGILRNHVFKNGRFHDAQIFSMLREDFEKNTELIKKVF